MDIRHFANYNGKMYFSADKAGHGEELWVTDGTQNGTKNVIEFVTSNTGGGSPMGFTELNGKLIFSTNDDDVFGRELWVTDGTDTGTRILKDIYPGKGHSNPGQFTKMDDKVYFAARNTYGGNNARENTELWVTDGTAAGTKMVKDIYPGDYSSLNGPFKVFNGKLYFAANDGVHGTELWVSDGTEAGTKMVKDIAIRDGIALAYSSNPEHFTEMSGKLYFTADDFYHGPELWVTDGTEAGTKMVKDIAKGAGRGVYSHSANPLPDQFAVYKNKLYFSAEEDDTHGAELWVTDGTEAGTKMVKDINAGKGNSYSVYQYIVYKDKLYFSARDGIHGTELWVTDGTDTGTKMVIDYVSGSASSGGVYFTAYKDHIFYLGSVSTDASNWQLFVSDGTAAGTKAISPFSNGFPYRALDHNFSLHIYNSSLYFPAVYDNDAEKLWSLRDTTGDYLLNPIEPQDSSNYNYQINNNDNWVTVSPNPGHGVYYLETNDTNVVGRTINVYDIVGRKVSSIVADKTKTAINIAHTAQGVYFIQLLLHNKKYVFRVLKL